LFCPAVVGHAAPGEKARLLIIAESGMDCKDQSDEWYDA
jgi:hypothetical protein